MRNNFPIIPARYYVVLCEFLEQEGVDIQPMLEQAGIGPAFFRHPESLLSVRQAEQLVHLALRATKRPDLGLQFGRAVKLSSHSMVGYAMLTSPNVGYALNLCARFFNLVFPLFTLRYTQTSEFVELNYKPAMPMSRTGFLFNMEALVSTVHWELNALLDGGLPLYSVLLSIDKPGNAEHYRKLTGATHHFGWNDTPGLKFIFPVEIANSLLEYSDPAALRVAEARCVEMQRALIKEESLVDWIKMILMESPKVMVSLGEIAGMLHLSERTLDRYLGKENVRFHDIRKQVLHDKAIQMLNDPSLSITHIAHQLGYTDSSNFRRAFRQVTGKTPKEFRLHAVVE